MAFIGLVIIAILLYIRNYKVSALILFFFFLTSGFNLVPEEITKFFFLSKGSDYALLILLGILAIDTAYYKGYLKSDEFTKLLIPFGIFLIICILYSKFIIGVAVVDIIRTCRFVFFWAAWFVFRSMQAEQLILLLKSLFYVTVCCSVLYVLQIVFDQTILNETVVYDVEVFGILFPRYYNQPDMLHFFVLMAVFCNPTKGLARYVTSAILILAMIGAFHRSHISFFCIAVLIGFLLQLPRSRRIKIIAISSVFVFGAVLFEGYRFVHSKTFHDIKLVLSGEFVEVAIDLEMGLEELQESTFTYRMAHFFERSMYLQNNPKAMLFGVGLMPEDSPKTDVMFDFNIGIEKETSGRITQLDSPDISYSGLILRFGYLGTLLFLIPVFALMLFFYRHKENKYALFSFAYLAMDFGTSFFSSNFMLPITFLLPMISYMVVNKQIKENEPKY
jgi:hypothetical protein